MTIVVDASLAVKWFLLEANSSAARDVLATEIGRIAVPAVFGIEVCAALVREANNDKANTSAMRSAIARLTELIGDGSILAHDQTPAQITRAADIAINLGHPLKDCIYLALAMDLNCDLITCDARFAAKARGVWDRVRVLGDVVG
jgi:predicted nucleic acid-binding protein